MCATLETKLQTIFELDNESVEARAIAAIDAHLASADHPRIAAASASRWLLIYRRLSGQEDVRLAYPIAVILNYLDQRS